MAKKELVEKIVTLYSKLGGNLNNVLGSRSNVTFLGTGKNPEPFIDLDLNIEAVGALGKSRILKELESPMGYLTADKLNDIQATKLYQNMLKLEDFYYPKAAPANITDMATRTRDLTAEGLGSLRTRMPTKKMIDDAIEDASPGFANDRKVDAELVAENLAQRMGLVYDDLPTKQRLDLYSKAFTALSKQRFEGVGSQVARRNKEGVMAFDDLDSFKDDIAEPFQDAETTFRNLEKQGQGDLAIQLQKLMMEGPLGKAREFSNRGNLPAKRGSAREFLVEALKEDDTFATKLSSVISPEDVRYITEGGGGVAGDPLFLVEKYFGPRILEAIPPGATGEDILTFTKRVMNDVVDAAGNKPDNPRFDRMTARFLDLDPPGGPKQPFKDGGRTGFRLGKSVFSGIANLFKKGADDADLIKQEETFRSGPITMDFLETVDPKVTDKFIRTRDMKGSGSFGLYSNISEMPQGLQAAEFLKKIRVPGKNQIDYEKAEMFIGGGVKLSGKESLNELIEMFLNAMKSYKSPFAKGGLAKILEV